MSTIEIVSAILLILSCILIIIIVFFQGAQKGGMSQSITGQGSDNYYQRNMGRSKEARLKKGTTVLAVLFFSVAIAVNLIAARLGDNEATDTENATNGGTGHQGEQQPAGPAPADNGTNGGDSDNGTNGGESDNGANGGDSDNGTNGGDSDNGTNGGESDNGTNGGESDNGTNGGESDNGTNGGESDNGTNGDE
ncbi:MAG: preprotein translocase subunit SecG [Oscillospiraceae bacterium]|nr:preprotein translocase subunit SecG [Oscillospiraceae bacterium]